jgi:DNA polymerase-3 subunit chi
MTKVDFYILQDSSADSKVKTACKIAEKAYQQQLKIYIHTASMDDAKTMDELLWTYRAGSFLPHSITETQKIDQQQSIPILIGVTDSPVDHRQVLLNLSDDVPLFFSQFDRVAELVAADEHARSAGRKRYRFYKDRGYELVTHELT